MKKNLLQKSTHPKSKMATTATEIDRSGIPVEALEALRLRLTQVSGKIALLAAHFSITNNLYS